MSETPRTTRGAWQRYWWLWVGPLLLFACCGGGLYLAADQTVVFDDVTVANSFLAQARGVDSFPVGMTSMFSVHVSGFIEGDGEFYDGTKWYPIVGHVDLQITGDYFQATRYLSYRPQNVTGGRLTIKYRFY